MSQDSAIVGVVMGSVSDWETMEQATAVLEAVAARLDYPDLRRNA